MLLLQSLKKLAMSYENVLEGSLNATVGKMIVRLIIIQRIN